MSTEDRFFHRIVASRRTGTVQRGHISLKQPMSIGTGSTADLRLEAAGGTILSIHAHVLVTETSEVQIVNLGNPGSMSLNGRPLYTAHPTTWVPGELVSIGDYELRLDAIDRTTAAYAKRKTTQTGALRDPKEPGDDTRSTPTLNPSTQGGGTLRAQSSTPGAEGERGTPHPPTPSPNYGEGEKNAVKFQAYPPFNPQGEAAGVRASAEDLGGEVSPLSDDEPTQPQPSVVVPSPHEMTFRADSNADTADISDGETPYQPMTPPRPAAVPPTAPSVPVPSYAASHAAFPNLGTAPFATPDLENSTSDNDPTPYVPLQMVNYTPQPLELPETLDSDQTAFYDPHKHPTRESEGSVLIAGEATSPANPVNPINALSPAMPAPMITPSQFTQPKNWMYTGKLSAQLAFNPVNLAPGERVYVPIAVRNEYSHSVELHVTVAGVPQEWITLSAPRLTLAPNEINTLDLIIQTPSSVTQPTINAVIRLSDVITPNIALNVPLSIVIKRAPDLVGWLDPAEINDPGPTYLYLQNHTQALLRVFVAGHCSTEGIHVVTNADWVDIPPGQVAKVPISVDIRQRPRLRGTQCQFWVTAQQGTRAPLAYAGVVRVRSSLGV